MKLSKQFFPAFVAVIILLAIAVSGCKKDFSASNATTTQQLSLYLTDDPSRFDSVYIDVKYVEVKIDSNEMHRKDDHFGDHDNDRDDDRQKRDEFGKWDTLSIRSGIYNISKLKNGIDTLMGTANIRGTIRKIRLTLGTNNSVLVSGVTYPLNFANGVNNYLYVKVNDRHHHHQDPAKTALWIDFDISRSITDSNGKYFLNPVLRPFCDKNFAKISGKVLPAAARALVTVFNNTDTSNAIPEKNGDYKIRGLKAGTYTILFKGYNGYNDSTLRNIQLVDGVEKIIPIVTLSL